MPTPREASQDISLLHIVATLPHSPGDAFQRQSRRRKLQVDYFHVIKDDLLAPYRTKERRRREELCTALHTGYACPLRFEDFLSTFDDKETVVQSITPLQRKDLRVLGRSGEGYFDLPTD
jgi:hypothetical protein